MVDKPRDFFLHKSYGMPWTVHDYSIEQKHNKDPHPMTKEIHVVEKQAYDQAIETLEFVHKNLDETFISPTAVMLIAKLEATLKELGELDEPDK